MNWCRVTIGFVVSIFVGHAVIWILVEKLLWPHIKKGYTSEGGITWLTGMVERGLYTLALLAGMPLWIGLWLGVKVTARFQNPDPDRETIGSYDIWLIGSGLSVFFGFLGALIPLGWTALVAMMRKP